MALNARFLHVTGVVQGVGFRPFVYSLATRLGLGGWVLNSSDGVHCLVSGEPSLLAEFERRLASEAPPVARIDEIRSAEADPAEAPASFEIRESLASNGEMTLISPDISLCAECRSELTDPADRRFGYPFVNCTNCGPRFTIINDIPYDRPNTTMAGFEMCPECVAEYEDPSNRRFHAQPNACFACGPRLFLYARNTPRPPRQDALAAAEAIESDALWTGETQPAHWSKRDVARERKRSERILDAVARALESGEIVAIKGLGGFHLACDATNEEAVQRLRRRKHRFGKPFAVMTRDLESAKSYCEVGDLEAGLLVGTVRPIVLLKRRAIGGDGSGAGGVVPIAPGVAGDLIELGVVLPYTPIHELICSRVSRPLVMTSGNRSEEPIATGNAEAIERLSDIADVFLLHDRGIHSRYDDSVVRVVGDIIEPVRRARGFAPHPLCLPFEATRPILAAGPEQKHTFTLLKGSFGFVSQHIGDLENAETLEAFEATLDLYERLFRIRPAAVAHDMHPEYLSTKWASALELPAVAVQHHHAHIASVTAEHGVEQPVLGIAFDGTGFGPDGTIWGGELLRADWREFTRLGHVRHMPLPGGSAAIRRPARMALGVLHEFGLLDHPGARPLLERVRGTEAEIVSRMVERRLNTPLTSSMGRLFDAVASLCGIRDDAAYEGEAAIELEAACDSGEPGTYPFPVTEAKTGYIFDSHPLIEAILDDIATGEAPGRVAARFHRAVVACIVDAARVGANATGLTTVALAGGVFANRLVLGNATSGLAEAGLTPMTHVHLPVNDGAISFGQAVVAWARLDGPDRHPA